MYFVHYKCLLRVLNFHIKTKSTISSYQIPKNMDSSPLNIKLTERLSSLVRPVNYKLLLHPNLKTGIFKGNVQITVITKQAKDFLALHTKFLDILKVQVHKGEDEVVVSKFLEIEEIEQLLIMFNTTLSPGSYKITIDFKGDLTRNIIGFYLSKLKDGRTMVASKFQPTYTRQAFPCFDEPDFKATYDITLVKPTSYVALSNMNEISRAKNEDNNTETVSFATSVPMSTYLACFVICDFIYKEEEIQTNGIGKNFKLRSFAQKNQMHKIDFAQDIGKRATEFYIKYYDVPFPLPKLDMIAIPDYQSGATEHWGLITYRETSFLVDEAIASADNKLSVANTIAHELAHMWFGNLVTLKWWDDLWLNEGFASYMQVKALNAIEPTWSMLDQFLIKSLHSVLVIDAKLSSHPIVQTVDTPDQITAIFDSISYSKGASVIRMLEGFLGEENFRLGVSDYLKKYQFGNTVTQDLLSSLEPYFKKDYPNLSLSYIMDTWTRQMGYPLVTVTKGDAPNTLVLTQSRYLLDPTANYDKNESPFKYRWFIPITYKTNKEIHDKILWFSDKEDNLTITLGADEYLIKVNNNQVGYYRVNYTTEMWKEIIQMLKNKPEQFTISDRAHLLNEVFALAQAEIVPYEIALDLSMYLIVEEDYVPWTTAAVTFVKLHDKLLGTPSEELLEKYIQRLVQPMYEKQSWERSNTSIIQSLVRTRVLSLAVRNSLPAAVRKVQDLFSRWLQSQGTPTPLQIEPQLRDLVYYYGMKSASQSDWDKLWKIFKDEEDVQEKSKLRAALSAPRDGAILKRYLELAWDEDNIRSQDYLSVVQQISYNPSGCDMVWEWVQANWPKLVKRFTLNSRYLGQMIPGITSSFSTEKKLGEMERLFARYPEAGAGESSRRSALEAVRGNVRWAAAHSDDLRAWLEAHV